MINKINGAAPAVLGVSHVGPADGANPMHHAAGSPHERSWASTALRGLISSSLVGNPLGANLRLIRDTDPVRPTG
jgi:hypothetical protein